MDPLICSRIANLSPPRRHATQTVDIPVSLQWGRLDLGHYTFHGAEFTAELSLEPRTYMAKGPHEHCWLLEVFVPDGGGGQYRAAWNFGDDTPSLPRTSDALAWATRLIVGEAVMLLGGGDLGAEYYAV